MQTLRPTLDADTAAARAVGAERAALAAQVAVLQKENAKLAYQNGHLKAQLGGGVPGAAAAPGAIMPVGHTEYSWSR
jgi:hypothetical protein